MTNKNVQTPIVRSNDTAEIRAKRNAFDGIEGVDFFINQKALPDSRAHFTMKCVERWAMVAGEPDGVDDAGRQKLRRMTPDELVDHATKTADTLFRKMKELGWLLEVPTPDEAKDILRQAEDAAEATND